MGLGLGLGLNKPKGLIYFQNQFSMEFDGSDDKILTDGADTVLQNTTYSFWCKTSTTTSNFIFGHGSYNIGAFQLNSGGTVPLLYLGASYKVFWSDIPQQEDGKWHHWVVYQDVNNVLNSKLYCDGVLQTVTSTTAGTATAYTESLTIGCNKTVNGDFFEGSIDEFAVFDRELTQAEITRMYNTYYTNNLVKNSNFEEIGGDVVQNGKFEQIGDEEVTNGTFDLGNDVVENGGFEELGNELVTCGNFSCADPNAEWITEAGWLISGGSANYDFITNSKYLRQTLLSGGFVSGKSYRINFEITDGTAYMNIKSNAETLVSSNLYSTGSYSLYITASANGSDLLIYGINTQGTAFSISNVSVKEVDPNDRWSIANNTGTNTRIENGGLTIETNGTYTQATQSGILEINKNYKLVYDVTATDGGDLGLETGGATSLIPSTIGTHTFYWTSNSTTFNLKRYGGALNITIDNVSVQKTNWEVGGASTINNGLAVFESNTNAYSYIRQDISSSTTKVYKIELEVKNYVSGAIQAGFTGSTPNLQNINATGDGVYTVYASPNGNGNDIEISRLHAGGNFNFDIDNVSVKEVGQGFTFGDGWGMGDGKAVCDGSQTGNSALQQSGVAFSGKIYKIQFDLTVDAGFINYVNLGGWIDNTNLTISDTYTYYTTTTTNTDNLGIAGDSNFVGSVDNISVQEVGQHWTFGSSWSTNGTEAIFTTGSGTAIESPIGLIGNRTYRVSCVVTGSPLTLYMGSNTVGISVPVGTYNANIVTASNANGIMAFRNNPGGASGTLDSIVVQQLKHQATNLLVNSGDYQSANPLLTSTKSMFFDGIDDYLDVGDVGTVKSMSFWFNPDNDITASSSAERLFGFSTTYLGIISGAATGSFSGETLTVLPDSPSRTATTKEFDAGRWYNIVIAWNETASYFDIYVDGVLSTDLNAATHTLANWTNFRIGSANDNAQKFNGKITEVGNWDRTLTALEVASLYNQGVPTDLLVNRNNYQSGNPTVFNTKQVDFDGVDDYMQISPMGLTGEFTYSFWYNGNQSADFLVGETLTDKKIGFVGANYFVRILSSSDNSVPLGTLEWNHLVVTRDSSNKIDLYVNGGTANRLFSDAAQSSTVNFDFIGKTNSSGQIYDGKISQIGVWNSTLTADEVSSLYNHGLPIDLTTNQAAYASSSNLVGYWRMGSGTNDGFPIISDQLSPSFDYISTTNLLTYSEDFTNAIWIKLKLGAGLDPVITSNYTTSPDGSNNASRIIFDRGSVGASNYSMLRTNVTGLTNPHSSSISFYAKSNTASNYTLIWYNESLNSTEIIITPTWKRYTLSANSITNTSDRLQFGLWDFSGTTSSSYADISIWGAQLEQHPIATPYVKSNGIPGQRKSSTTNLFPYSEDFANSAWSKSDSFITPNSTISPDGTQNASTLTTTAAGGTVQDTLTVSDGVVTFSLYVKKGSTNGVRLRIDAATDFNGYFDLTDGTIHTTTGVANIEVINNDWYRVSITGNVTSFVKASVYTTDGTTSYDNGTLFIWAAQLEQQTQATPYIKTNGSPVTVEFYKENNYAEMVNLMGGADFSDGIENGSPYANIVQNGTFDTDSDWIFSDSNSTSIANGTLNVNGTQSGTVWAYQSGVTSGKQYKFVYTVTSLTSGEVRAGLSGVNGTWRNSTGTYTEYLTPTSGTIYLYFNSDFVGSIDNVSVSEVNTGLQGYWKMGDGTNDEYPIIYDQTNPDLGSEEVSCGNFECANPDGVWSRGAGWGISGGTATYDGSGGTQPITQNITNIQLGKLCKLTIDVLANQGGGSNTIFFGGTVVSSSHLNVGSYTFYDYFTSNTNLYIYGRSGEVFQIDNVSVKQVNGNPATMTAMPEGNITNQYPLTKIRNYYRMGDGILDSKFLSYPTNPNTDAPYIFQDQTSPNLAHIPTTNLVLQSNQFDTTWSESNLTLTSGQSGINNTNDAWLFNATGSSANVTQSVSSSGDNTFSVFAKAGTENSIFIRISGSNSPRAFFNLTNGTLIAETNTTHTSIKNVGNDWYRVSITGNDTITDARIYVANSSQSFPSSGNIYVQNSQLEKQSQATAYIKSDGIAAVRKSSTTNLLDYSEDFSKNYWHKDSQVNLTPNYAIAPDGTMTAYKATSTYNFRTASNLTIDAGTVCTFSVYIKNIDATSLNFVARDNTNATNYYGKNYTSEVNTNDWTRVEFTFTTSTGTANLFYINSQSVTPLGDYLVWGAQLEVQTQAETYAKTTGLPVTIDLFTENNYGHTQGGIIQKDVPRNS